MEWSDIVERLVVLLLCIIIARAYVYGVMEIVEWFIDKNDN